MSCTFDRVVPCGRIGLERRNDLVAVVEVFHGGVLPWRLLGRLAQEVGRSGRGGVSAGAPAYPLSKLAPLW